MTTKHTHTLSIRITSEMAALLKRREELLDVPTSRFVRKLIENDMNPYYGDTSKPNAFDLERVAAVADIEPIPYEASEHEQEEQDEP